MPLAPLRFEVSVNGQRLAVMGVEDLGVLSAIVSWVRRNPADITAELRQKPDFDEKEFLTESCTLGLSSLSAVTGHHSAWPGRPLQPGDEVTVRILAAGQYDEPEVI